MEKIRNDYGKNDNTKIELFNKLFKYNVNIPHYHVKLEDIKNKLKYEHPSPAAMGDHIGQRKLLLSEVQFLTQILLNRPYMTKLNIVFMQGQHLVIKHMI